MPRRSWVWDPKVKALVEITPGAIVEQRAPMIVPDLPGYVSPVTGLWVEGRKQRREDMKRTNSRPWEGMDQEKKEAARQRGYVAAKQEVRLHEHASRAYYQLSPEKRRELEGR